MGSAGVWRAWHRAAGDSRHIGGFVDGRLGIHSLLRADVLEGWICGGLLKRRSGGLGPGVVTDEMEMAAIRGGDTERLLHEAVGLVAVAIRTVGAVLVGLAVLTTVRRVGTVGSIALLALRWSKAAAAALALHLAVGEKAARDSAGTPRLAVSPPTHARFAFIPYKHRSGFDLLALLLGQSSLDPRQDANAAGLEQDNCVLRRPYLAVIRLHE